jgi:IS30 family transposase
MSKWLAVIAYNFSTKENANNYQPLTTEEPFYIYSLQKAGLSQTKIGVFLSRHRATISSAFYRHKAALGCRPRQTHQPSDTRLRLAGKNRKVTTAIIDNIVCLIRQELCSEQESDY